MASIPGIIQNLRQRPDHHRKAFALLSSAAITLLIAAAWAVNVPNQWAIVINPPTSSQPAVAELSVIPSPSSNQSSNQDVQTQGFQFINSIKSDFNNMFSGGSATSNTGNNSPLVNQVSITNPPFQSSTTDNPYANLKYYVSQGVLISNPTTATPKK